MVETDEESRRFWEEREKQKGGKVEFFTFAAFMGRSRDRHVNLGGLLYIINKTVTFEDFEKDNWFAKIISRKQKYEKTEFSFKTEDITEIKTVSKNSALNCISGIIDDRDTKRLSNISGLFFQALVQIKLKSGYSLFFDVMKRKEFTTAVS